MLATVAASHQMALRRQLDLAANNLANMNTTGYQREDAMFNTAVEPVRRAASPAARAVAMVIDTGIARDTARGDFQPTGNPLDVAIDGDAFLVMRTSTGAAYTRNGHLQVLNDGLLGMANGAVVLDTSGQPVRITEEDHDLAIAEDGTISSDRGVIAQLALVRFEAADALTKRGDTLLEGGTPIAVAPGSVALKAGMLEGSNVKPIVESTAIIEILRRYQATTRLSERVNDLRSRAIERLGRVQ